ncbi:MAG: prenyltransferase/squalene oxidase repeat-containing protein [Phycisphaerae bacterium]
MSGAARVRRASCAAGAAWLALACVARGADPPPRLPPGITPQVQAAIRNGLSYLAAKQGADGSWREESGGPYGGYPIAMTSLSATALAMSGSTPTSGAYSAQLSRSVGFLMASVQPNGLICRAGDEQVRSMYGHGFAMLFLSQMLGMEGDPERMEAIRRILQKGVVLTGGAQSEAGGWIYTATPSGDEGSVTVTQVQALRSCRDAGIAVPKRIIDRAMRYLELSQQEDGGIAYRLGMQGSRPPITAAAVVCWFNAGEYDNPRAVRALRLCKKRIRPNEADRDADVLGHYFYAHHYYAQAVWLAGEREWNDYFPAMREQLLARQNDDGSWDGDGVGRIYGTALALSILQLPYNYLPIYQR